MTTGLDPNRTPSFKTCPACGLQLAANATVCPRDGTIVTSALNQDPAFEKYELLEIIGQGGMGVIYKARHLVLNKLVAVKTLHSSLPSSDAIRRFQLEGKAASLLSHPNIVAVYDLGVTKFGQPYMIMEYVDGKTLADLLRLKGHLRKDEFFKIFLQVCQALSAAHKKSILHRDIKPSNIMIVRSESGDEVRIMDFGIAKIMSDSDVAGQNLTKTGDTIGSPLYMSPEQARGVKTDQRSDLYSLGCVMYEALTGSPPFQGNSMMETLLLHMEKMPMLMREASMGIEIDPRLEGVVMRLLRKNADERYSSMDELIANLTAIRDGGQAATKVIEPEKIAKPARKTTPVLLVTLVFLGCAIFAAFWFLRPPQAPKKVEVPTSVTESKSDNLTFTEMANADTAAATIERLIKTHARSVKVDGYTREVKVTDADIKPLQGAIWVREIEFPMSEISDKGLEVIAKLTDLESIDLSNDEELRDLHALSNLKKLETLKVADTKINGQAIKVIATLSNLTYLDLSQTQLTETDVKRLYSLKNLKSLDIVETHLDKSVVDALKAALTQCKVTFDHKNSLSDKNIELLVDDAGGLIAQHKFGLAEKKLNEAEEIIERDPHFDLDKKAEVYKSHADLEVAQNLTQKAVDKYALVIKLLEVSQPNSRYLANTCSTRATLMEQLIDAHPELKLGAAEERRKVDLLLENLLKSAKDVSAKTELQASIAANLDQLIYDYARADQRALAENVLAREQKLLHDYHLPVSFVLYAAFFSLGDSYTRAQHLEKGILYYQKASEYLADHNPNSPELFAVRMAIVRNKIAIKTDVSTSEAETSLKGLLDQPLRDSERRAVLRNLVDLLTARHRDSESLEFKQKLDKLPAPMK